MKDERSFVIFVTRSNILATLLMAPLKPMKLPEKVLYFFCHTACIQDLGNREGSFEHVPNPICAQQICCKCEAVDDFNVDCEQFCKHIHAFW